MSSHIATDSPRPAEASPYRALLGLVALVGGLAGMGGLYFVPIPEAIASRCCSRSASCSAGARP